MRNEGMDGAIPEARPASPVREPLEAGGAGLPPLEEAFRVRFTSLVGQWGAKAMPANSFGLGGRGDVTVESSGMTVTGERQRSFRGSTPVHLVFPRRAIVNVLCLGRLVRLEIRDEGHPPYLLTFWLGDARAAARLAGLLPTVRTGDFSAAAAEHEDFRARVGRLGGAVVTPALVALNVAVFIGMGFAGAGFLKGNAEVAIRWGSNFGPLTTDGQWWRLATALFVHFGLLHILFNMWALFDVGRVVERFFGSLRFLFIYLFAGLASSLSSLLWNPGVNSAGASGAIFGILGALLAFLLRKDCRVPLSTLKRYRTTVLVFTAYAMVFGFLVPNIDNAAHVGGLTSGFLMGYLLARPLDPECRKSLDGRRIALAAALGAVTLTALAVPVFHPSERVRREQLFRRDVIRCAENDELTVKTFREFAALAREGKLSDEAGAQRIQSELLPPWGDLFRSLTSHPLKPSSKLYALQRAYLDYVMTTRTGLELYVAGIRGHNPYEVRQGAGELSGRRAIVEKIRTLQKKMR